MLSAIQLVPTFSQVVDGSAILIIDVGMKITLMWSRVSESSLEKSPSSSFCGRKGQDWIIKLREQSSILIDSHTRQGRTGSQSETAWGASSRNYCKILPWWGHVRQISGLRSISSIKTKMKLHFLPADVEFNTFQSKQSNSIFADFHHAMNNNVSKR